MAAKKITRKELLKSPDEFLSISEKAYIFIKKHSQRFLTGILVILTAILLVIGIRWYMSYSDAQAVAAYNRAMGGLNAQNPNPEQAQTAIAALEKMIQEHSGTEPARYALLDLGRLYYSQGMYDKSQGAFKAWIDEMDTEEETLKPFVLSSYAYSLEASDQKERAVAVWKEISENYPAMMNDEALLGLGRLYLALDKKEEAKKVYQEIITETPDTPQAAIAKDKLSELEK